MQGKSILFCYLQDFATIYCFLCIKYRVANVSYPEIGLLIKLIKSVKF